MIGVPASNSISDNCENCFRRHVNLVEHEGKKIRRCARKTYYSIQRRTAPSLYLCGDCSQYLQAGCATHYWPGMIWKFLSSNKHETDDSFLLPSIQERWKLIPMTWRGWWLEALRSSDITMETPAPEVFDVTVDRKDFANTIERLHWVSLAKAMDKYLAIPTIRCPWGCSAFLHEANELPYEDFLLAATNYAFPSHSKCKKPRRNWTDSCRKDFPRTAILLENEEFLCRPSITVSASGVHLLCCKNHSSKTTQRYLHVPENPTGSLFTSSSNQFAPVVLRARTLRKAKTNQFSDTYQTVRLQGGYDGIDSCYLSAHGNYSIANALSQRRDSLSIQGRDDVKHHVAMLCQSTDSLTYLPGSNIEEKIDLAKIQYPCIDESCKEELAASTYVSLVDAVALQEHTYNQVSISLLVENEETGSSSIKLFDPPWPLKTIRVHNYDSYGERFSGVPNTGGGFRVWAHAAAIICVDDFWEPLTAALITASDPEGYLLSLAWKEVGSGSGKGRRGEKFFAVNTSKDDQLRQQLGLVGPGSIFPWPNEAIDVQQDSWSSQTCTRNIAVVYYDDPIQSCTYHEPDDNSNEDWEAVLLVSDNTNTSVPDRRQRKGRDWDGCIYARHGGPMHRCWWIQPCVSSRFMKSDVSKTIRLPKVRFAVYRRKKVKNSISLRESYLKCLGGQSAIYCTKHLSPLITAPNDRMQCCCDGKHLPTTDRTEWETISEGYCGEKATYICSESSCLVGICANDFRYLSDGLNGGCFILGDTQCRNCPQGISAILSARYNHSSPENNMGDNNEPFFFDGRHAEKDSSSNPDDEMGYDSDDASNKVFNDLADEHYDADEFGPVEAHEFALDLINYGETEDVVDEPYEGNRVAEGTTLNNPFHMTAAHNDDILQATLIAEKEIASAPLHVQLNRQGHCLVRRNAKLRMVRQHKAFFQRIVARCKSTTIPLVYAEGALFPDIFYYSTEYGEVLGALPAALWTDRHTLSKYGIASMRAHACQRVQDPALLTCTDSRYHFLQLDCLVNLALRGNDSRLVLHRGFAERQNFKEGVLWKEQEGHEEIYEDDVENHSNVHKLARLIEESPPDYFYTQSCNQATCKGLGVLRRWVTSPNAEEKVQAKYDLSQDEAKETIRMSAAPYVQRSWNAFIDLWMRYIIHSSEQPLGPIDWAWFRKEFQDLTGNVSHMHSVIKTLLDTSTASGRNQVLEKIRGALGDLLHYHELCKLKEEGIIDSLEFYEDILNDAVKYLTHKCGPRCQVPRTDENGDTTWVCKRPDNFLLSSSPGSHTIEEVHVSHSASALEVLQELDFAEDQENGVKLVTHPKLQMKRHVPKCCQADGKFSPTNGELFVKFPSSQNLQHAGGHCLANYLAGYVASVDKVARVNMKGPTRYSPNEIRATHESLHNTKIASVKHYNQKKDAENAKKKKNYTPPVGRPVTQMEALTVIQGDALVSSTREFVFIPTCPREFRAATSSPYLKASCRPQDLQAVLAVTGQTVRYKLRFPQERLFSQRQMEVIQDELEAPLRTDQITYFSMRPPELLFVDNVIDYTRWFLCVAVCPLFDPQKSMDHMIKALHVDIEQCAWMDGFNNQILLREAAVGKLYEFTLQRQQQSNASRKPSDSFVNLLRKLWRWSPSNISAERTGANIPQSTRIIDRHMVVPRSSRIQWERLSNLFLHNRKQRHLPVVWWTPVYPRRKTAFLVQLLLCEGKFETEYELMMQGNLRSAFQAAGLLDENDLGGSMKRLLSTFVIRHLRLMNGGSFQFDRNLVEARAILGELFLGEQTPGSIPPTPSVLFASMVRDTDKKIGKHLDDKRKTLIDAVYSELEKCEIGSILPTKDEVMNARSQPVPQEKINKFFPPPRHPSQNEASYLEQTTLMSKFKQSVDDYRNCSTNHRNLVTVGGPGVGKTTVAMVCTLYALCLGLNGITTSLVSDRSKELGGIHFHQLISLIGRSDSVSPGRAAEMALSNLYRNPEAIEFLRRLDFINLDEFGVFSAENFAIFDMVCRYIRGSPVIMGGIFLFCTMDHLQLLPFRGIPVLLSMYVITDFTFIRLEESVRAANDPVLREIIRLTRLLHWTERDENQFTKLVGENCTFVDNFDDPTIPPDAVFVFGRKGPCQAAEDLLLERMKAQYSGRYCIVECHDEESTTTGNWHTASEGTRLRLDKNIKQRRQLVLYPGARFEFTHVAKNKFNQGQLALLLKVPSEKHIRSKLPLEVFKAPSGVKHFPPESNCNQEWLEANGWSRVNITFETTQPEPIGRRLQARRTQYGIKPRVSSTIHACMGSTLPAIVTAVVCLKDMPYNFSLWEAAQVVVLLSRTRMAEQIIFVGNKNDTVKHLLDVLRGNHSRFLKYINNLLSKLCGEDVTTSVIRQPTVFRPKDTVMASVPGVYLIISTAQPNFCYIGETASLSERLNTHNNGTGPGATANFGLLPFAMYAYVVGFQNKGERLEFESLWKVTARRKSTIARNNNGLVHIARELVEQHNRNHPRRPKLRLIQCGTVTTGAT